MLLALTHGKAGRIKQDIKAGGSWREMFRTSEDLLTASVFGRLAYLDGPLLWKILRNTFGHALPEFRYAELVNVEFWPTWNEADNAGATVEPDIFMQFEVGDPVQRIDVIVEAKLGLGQAQYADQWRRQWRAYQALTADIGEASAVYLVAVGGMGHHTATSMRRILAEIDIEDGELNAVAANWPSLADRIFDALQDDLPSRDQRILDDIVEALALAGYRHIKPLSELQSTRRFNSASLRTLLTYEFGNQS